MGYYYVDFKCKKCKAIFNVTKNTVAEDFPKSNCPECGSKNTHRVYSNLSYEVAIGGVGNSREGYSKQILYHPGTWGNLKRTRIK